MTYQKMFDYNFWKNKNIFYIPISIVDNPKQFAQAIIKFPEIKEEFVREVKMFVAEI